MCTSVRPPAEKPMFFQETYRTFLETLTPAPPAVDLEAGRLTQESVTKLFIHHLQRLLAPTFLKGEMIKKGRIVEALDAKPQGIWYASEYAQTLHEAGDATINGSDLRASELYNTMRAQGLFLQAIYGPKEHWETIPDLTSRTRIRQDVIVMKISSRPTEALESLVEGLSFFECRSILSLSAYFTLKTIWGDDLFNHVMESFPKFQIGIRNEAAIITKGLLQASGFIIPRGDLVPSPPAGAYFYIRGVPSYVKKHRHGSFKGLNLFCVGENKFTSFGLDPRGISLHEVKAILLKAYNDPAAPLDISASSEHLEMEFGVVIIQSGPGECQIVVSLKQYKTIVREIEERLSQDQLAHAKNLIESQTSLQTKQKEELQRLQNHTISPAEFEETMIDMPCFAFEVSAFSTEYFRSIGTY